MTGDYLALCQKASHPARWMPWLDIPWQHARQPSSQVATMTGDYLALCQPASQADTMTGACLVDTKSACQAYAMTGDYERHFSATPVSQSGCSSCWRLREAFFSHTGQPARLRPRRVAPEGASPGQLRAAAYMHNFVAVCHQNLSSAHWFTMFSCHTLCSHVVYVAKCFGSLSNVLAIWQNALRELRALTNPLAVCQMFWQFGKMHLLNFKHLLTL